MREAGTEQAELLVAPLLGDIAAQASAADQSRSVDARVLQRIRDNDVMRLTASAELGGLDGRCQQVGEELSAVAVACGSTAWCLWNHLCTFHLFCGLLGPEHEAFLREITHSRQWVCFPAGASTAVRGVVRGADVVLSGQAAFGSGARYADWAGVSFVLDEPKAPRFSMVDLHQDGVRIEATWDAMSLRASATDHVFYEGGSVPAARMVPFPLKYRVRFRAPDYPVIHHRYREDWVGLSDLWLGMMAVGVTQACLDECCEGIRDRIAIMGTRMVERPTIHVNLGQASALVDAARDTVTAALRETDARIDAGVIPTEADYLRQLSASMLGLQLCDEAMRLVLRVLGGNGLRESASFERRYRDFQAMPLHINAHRDRVTEQVGRHRLGLDTENPF